MRLHEAQAVKAVAAGATAFAATKYGLAAMVPALGPVGAPIVTIAIGVALAVFLDHSGTVGDVVEGAGYGLIIVGVFELGK